MVYTARSSDCFELHDIAEQTEERKKIIFKVIKENVQGFWQWEKSAHGIYISPDAWKDEMYLLHLRCGQAVFSHETALFFHDLTDREPSPYSITVKTGYNPSSLRSDGIRVYTVKNELHLIGVTTAMTTFGNQVLVYDMERTICDLIRSRSNIEIQSFQGALKQYAGRKDKNLRVLMRYAGMFRVEKILRQYMEVLL